MTTREIYDILIKNGMKAGSDLADPDRRGYDSDAAQRFSAELIEKLGELVAYGVNNGFNGSMKDTAELLADMIVSMSKRKITEKISKLRTRADEALSHTRYTRTDGVDVRAPVLSLITSSLSGLDVIAEREAGNARIESFVARSRELLGALRTAVTETINVTSVYASECAAEIIGRLRVWRSSVATRQFDSLALENLTNAVNEAEKWKAITVKGDHVKKDNVPVVPHDDYDNIVRSNVAIEALSGLRAELDRKRAAIKRLEDARAALLDERRKSSEELTEIMREWQNGRLDDVTADMRSGYAESNVARVDEELIPVEAQISSERSALDICRRLEHSLSSYENDPIMLNKLVENVDFGRVNAFLMGHLNAEDGKKLVDDIDLVISVQLKKIGETAGIKEDFTSVIKRTNDEWRNLAEKTRAQVATGGQQREDAKARMLRRMGMTAETQSHTQPDRLDLTRESEDPRKEDL